jgi:hypothetical protein
LIIRHFRRSDCFYIPTFGNDLANFSEISSPAREGERRKIVGLEAWAAVEGWRKDPEIGVRSAEAFSLNPSLSALNGHRGV